MTNEVDTKLDPVAVLAEYVSSEILERGHLAAYAAHAACAELLKNWRAAQQDSYKGDLVGDVDDVISILRAFQLKAREVLPQNLQVNEAEESEERDGVSR